MGILQDMFHMLLDGVDISVGQPKALDVHLSGS